MTKKADVCHVFVVFLFVAVFFQVPRAVFALDPNLSLNQYVLDEWSTANGLPSNVIFSISQTLDGYIWFGSGKGLIRFDGRKFTVFDKKNTPEFSSDTINELHSGKSGALWIGTNEGLVRYHNRVFKRYSREDGLSSNIITDVFEDIKGNLWVGTADGYLNCIRNDKIEIFNREKGLDDPGIFSIYEDNRARLMVSTKDKGLYVLENERFQLFKTKNFNNTKKIIAITGDRYGYSWTLTPHGIILGKDDEFDFFSKKNGLSSNFVTAFLQDKNGNTWIGTINGINRLKKSRGIGFQVGKTLENIFITRTFEDSEGSIWIGTNGDGVKRFREGKFITFTRREGLENDHIISLYRDKPGRIWISTPSGMITFKDNRFTNHIDEFPFEAILTVKEDSKNNLWFGTYYYGLYRLKNGELQNFTMDNGLSSNIIYHLLVDRTGNLLAATNNGVCIYKNGFFSGFGNDAGLMEHIHTVYFLFEDRSGKLFAGTGKGLFLFSNGKFSPYHSELTGIRVNSMIETGQHEYWVGTLGEGLKRLKNGILSSIKEKDGLPTNNFFSLIEDQHGYLWAACDQGIVVSPIKHLNDYCQGTRKGFEMVLYTEADGLKTTDIAQLSTQSLIKNSDGKLWFATKKGISIIDPGHIKVNKVAPPVIIEEVFVSPHTSKDSKSNTRRAAGLPEVNRFNNIKKIEFQFTAATFISNEKVRFKYKLDGFDENWSELGGSAQRKAVYSKLPSGNYTFKVTACNSDGVWNNRGDAFEFEVYRYFPQTFMFRVIIIIVFLFLISGIFYWLKKHFKLQKIKKRNGLSMAPGEIDEVLKKLMILLKEERVYRDEALTLMKLAERLQLHPQVLSQIINEKMGKNFNDLINNFRIEEVKTRLKAPGEAGRSVLEIAFDCGFNSKTSFNRTFKKFTGMTPSNFKKESR
jgi:ligand-binding sensor domain-containing protein/AraC-like DNA-binding protein